MARIPQETVDRLKREVSIADLAARRGIRLERRGEDNWMARCPWHEDATPSLCISPSKNLWHCLGACQEGGDVIQWVMKMDNLGFRRAVEVLLAGSGIELQTTKRSATQLPQIDLGEDDRTLKTEVTRYYAERLHAPTSPDGLAYLERRGIRNDELIERFRIGFADRTLGFRVPPKDYKTGREMRERLERVGFWREATGREHFNGCVTFPLFDQSGEVVQVYGRKIRDDVRFKHGSHLYLPGPQRGVWNREGIAAGDGTVIVCEAIIDAATFWCAGFRNVTTAYGVNGFTSEILDAFKADGITRVLIAYDRDEAGDKAAEQLALSLGREGMGVFRAQSDARSAIARRAAQSGRMDGRSERACDDHASCGGRASRPRAYACCRRSETRCAGDRARAYDRAATDRATTDRAIFFFSCSGRPRAAGRTGSQTRGQ